MWPSILIASQRWGRFSASSGGRDRCNGGEPSPQVVKAATRTIPIVFMANGDPVASGLVASFNRPGGNMTGVTIFGMMAVGKRLELLRQVMPKDGIIAYLINPNNPNREIDNVQTQQQVTALLVASEALGLTMPPVLLATADEVIE